MSKAEETIRATVTPVLLPGEQIVGIGASPIEPSRLWVIAIGIGFFMGILPGLILGLYVLAKSTLDVPYLVATNRRLFVLLGKAERGFLRGLRVIDLGQVASVEERVDGATKRLTLALRSGSKVTFTKVPRNAARGLSQQTTESFFEQFPSWLRGELPNLAAAPALTGDALKAPSSAGLRRLKMVQIAFGVVGLAGFGTYLLYQAVVVPARERAEAEAYQPEFEAMEVARNQHRAEELRALGATPEAGAWLASLASAQTFRSSQIALSLVSPSREETEAVELVGRNAVGGVAMRSASFADEPSAFRLPYQSNEYLQNRIARALGQPLHSPPVRVSIDYADSGPRIRAQVHIRPAGGRVHRFDRDKACPIFDATVEITAEAPGAPTLRSTIEVPGPSDATLATSQSWRSLSLRSRCLALMGSEVANAARIGMEALLLREGVGQQ